MKNRLIVFIGLLLALTQVQAQRISSQSISKTGTTVAQFLKIGVSARSIGMGGAFVAVANDVSTIYTNPAGLALVDGYHVMFSHTNWIAGTNYDFGSFSIDLYDAGTLAFMVSALSSGDMDVTTVEQPEGTGERFSTQDFLIGVSYARKLTTNFSLGFTGKYIYQRLWHMSAGAVALDVGLLYKTPFWGINLGASIRNFGPKMRLDGRDIKFAADPDNQNFGNVSVVNAEYEMRDYDLPLYFQVGLAKDVLDNEYHRLTIAVDAVTPNDNYEAVNTGLEYGFKNMVFLRAGYKALFQDDTEEGLTLGAGLNIRLLGTTRIILDYAYADFGRLQKSDRFSLIIQF